ncbi:MAG: HAMP domain-containing protein, partial [Gammaproteobacteria bacterium]|nr:HAMP domain-containing protein [Gammaproteobacteria bacterium]
MKKYAISSKLLWISIVLFVVTVSTLSLTMWQALKSNNQHIANETQKALNYEIEEKLKAKASQYSERIAAFINEAYRVPYSFSAIMSNSGGDGVSRVQAQQLISATLRKNKQLSSFYTQFEANGFDNNDQQNLTNTTHSVKGAGSFEVYYIREKNGNITQSPVEDATQKYDETLNEFGVRAAEWFLCAKEKTKPCLMEPYLYEVTLGNSELMTSLTVPIIKQGQFVGLVGADINLPIFQSFIDELSQRLYQGRSKVTLLSEKGFIVASSHYHKKGRPLSEALDANRARQLQSLHFSNGILEDEKSIIVAQPVKIDIANSTWSIIIEVDKKDALASALALQKNMNKNTDDMTRLQIMLGFVITLIAVFFIWLMTKSIVAPINMLKNHMETLASEDGDLTQKIEVESHAELIALGNGFNHFLAKLQSLISQLKQLTVKTQAESESTAR